MNLYLDPQRQPLAFLFRARKVRQATLKSSRIACTLGAGHPSVESSSALLEEFANLEGTPDSILDFTRKYGPLTLDPSSDRDSFVFTLDEWRHAQREFRKRWRAYALLPGQPITLGPRTSSTLEGAGGEWFQVYGGRWIYRVCTLYRLLVLELLATPPNRLRRCARTDCRRYYVAHHRGGRYCSETCTAWGKRNSKLRWWKRTGDKKRREAIGTLSKG